MFFKVNEWCLIDSFCCEFRVFCLQLAFNGPLDQFFLAIQNICINVNPELSAGFEPVQSLSFEFAELS